MAILPQTPKDKELEEFVCALFQASRYFVEKDITEQDVGQVLQLDAVVTAYDDERSEPFIVEVKSGKWGFPDIFKVAGWMRYLDFQRGVFVVNDCPEGKDADFYSRKAKSIGIDLLIIEELDKSGETFSEKGFRNVPESLSHSIWRFSYWIERRIVEGLRQIQKSDREKEGPREALNYYQLVNDGIFFLSNYRERLVELYDAFGTHPKLTLGAANEMQTGEFNASDPDPQNPRIREAMYEGRHSLLQACMYLEHRARITVLKALIDYMCFGKDDSEEKLARLSLPSSCIRCIKKIREEPYFRLYPLFWQVFLWSWGGFFLTDRTDWEYKQLSRQTGIPVDEIPNAIEAYENLFPTPNGWLNTVRSTHTKVIKMFPAVFRGLGAFHRLKRLKFKGYGEFGYTDKTTGDLEKWHSCAVRILDGKK